MFRPLTRTQLIVDVVVALLFFVVTALPTLPILGLHWMSDVTPGAAFVTSAAFAGALALRRWAPALALAIAWIAAIVQMGVGLPPLPTNIAIFGILYGAAAYGRRVTYWVSFASAIVGAAVITGYLIVPPLLRGGWSFTGAAEQYAFAAMALFIAAALALLLGWTSGALMRIAIRARQNRRAQQRAEQETAAEAERTRIARDMHDVVAHSLAVVIAQADGARYAAAADPDAATAALGTISTTARAALSDVRMLLTQLRHTQADGPQPTLADLEQLYAQVRAAGVPLQIDIDPAPRAEVPASLQLAVYRIVQEALTNALRHGAGGPVQVALAWHPDRVELTIRNAVLSDPAPPPAEAPRGHGLIGMRERAQLVGGAVEAHPDGAGGFVVRATLPVREVA